MSVVGAVDLRCGDCLAVLQELPAASAHVCVTSPPYFGQRDYGVAGQVGLEATPDAYAARLVEVFRAVRRVLRPDGSLWLNLGDTYAGYHGNRRDAAGDGLPPSATNGWAGRGCYNENKRGDRRPRDLGLKEKDLVGVPWLVAFALRADGWYLRCDVIWAKPNPAPEPRARDRPCRAHEYLFLLTPAKRYYYDAEAVRLPPAAPGGRGRQRPSVWPIPVARGRHGHAAAYPPALAETCVLAGSPPGGTVLDPFLGSGTTAVAALAHRRRCVGIELNAAYLAAARSRVQPLLT